MSYITAMIKKELKTAWIKGNQTFEYELEVLSPDKKFVGKFKGRLDIEEIRK